MYLAMSDVDREGYPEVGEAYKRIAYVKQTISKFAELQGNG